MAGVQRLHLLGAAGGALFSVLVVVAFAIASGPPSARGDDVVAYFSEHGTAVAWQAAIIGVAIVFFIWFAETFATRTSAGAISVIGAAVTASLYLVAIGCWESLGETFNGRNPLDVSSEDLGDAHFLYDAGVGAAHMAHFTTAAYVGSMALVVLSASGPWQWLGWVGVALVPLCLLEAVIGLTSQSGWSDTLDGVVFVFFLAWVFLISLWLVSVLRRHAVAADRVIRV